MVFQAISNILRKSTLNTEVNSISRLLRNSFLNVNDAFNSSGLALAPAGLNSIDKELGSIDKELGSIDNDNEGNIWDIFKNNNGFLLAVPKKKVSHQKKRQRLYAPGSKQLKLKNNLTKCPSCGHYKLANTLCTFCVDEIHHIWKKHTINDKKGTPEIPLQEQDLSAIDLRVLYPGKKDTEYVKKLKDKDSYLKRKIRSLPVEEK
ncbi:hypothetical protein TPHA_0O00270 [Tetrapisispora phaffii CBS 4417]|uniref:Large ribosomal subunit protein bL32m n=1 Tax=Tetrapisispora phaffii (strain ATCC 24235 / CBS 4417 / NBRC 1672 / NRRL Y-8282 / UCD 70-5) TaxID=1071381 RepID=G8C1H1_TETPH|nr:mitochondrial 54S ribosomal protein YmL32 TPHA_0O00270 [Tetrapisispora phaffii CBS 4417]CCE65999.1 hypothetical protein TPHA_0O00270 [Tetrapisispora phaffii CBS 4417]